MSPGRQRTRSLRAQVTVAILAVAVLSVALFAIPLAYVFAHTFRDDRVVQLEQEATRVFTALPDRAVSGQDALPAPADASVQVALYDSAGDLVTGSGPATDEFARRALQRGAATTSESGGQIAVYVPFRAEAESPVIVRAATPLDSVERRTYAAWAILAALALVVLAIATAVALWRSRALSRPFEHLAASARDLGEGSFALRVPPTGVREAEDVARALESSAARIGDRVRREQRFAEDASHQLRTPLTAARLALEAAIVSPDQPEEPAIAEALVQVDRMEGTIDDLLRLTRRTGTTSMTCDVGEAVTDADRRWRKECTEARRTLACEVELGLPSVQAPESAVRQLLDILIENSLRHGQGAIRLRARDLAGAIAIDVSDDGVVDPAVRDSLFDRGSSGANSTGIGLSLAHDLAEAEGGRLRLTSPGHPTTFTLVLLPASGTTVDSEGTA